MSPTTNFLLNHGGLILFGVVFLEQIGLPIPSAPWLLAAGAVAASGRLSPLAAVAATILACLVADWIWFCLGRYRGAHVLRLLCRISLHPDSCVRKTQTMFFRCGMGGVVVAKFLPGVGLAFPPLAGMYRTHPGRFLLYDALGSLLYTGSLILLGLLFSSQLQQLAALFAGFSRGAFWVLIISLAAYVSLKYLQRKRLSRTLRLMPVNQPF